MSKEEICSEYAPLSRICSLDNTVCKINGYGKNVCEKYKNMENKNV